MKHNTTAREHVKVTWFGHSAFLFQAPGGKAVLIDPWLENPQAPSGAKEGVAPDIILISHGHSDHMGNCVEIAKRTEAMVISIFEVSLYLQSQGVSSAIGMNKGGTLDVDGVKVSMVDARHSSGIDVEGTCVPGGEPAGYVVEFENGFRIYHAGDTELFGDMKFIQRLYRPKAILLPVGDVYTMGPRAAAMACQMFTPRFIIGMHYGTFPVLTGNPEELKKHLTAALRKKLVVLKPGETRSL